MPRLEYRVLGPVELCTGEGQRVVIESPKQRLVLATLLVQPGRVVSAERLAEALWGDALPADPAGALQTHVSRLRGLLRGVAGRDPLVTEPQGYRLAAQDEEIDARRFEEQVRAARREEDPRTALALLEEALDRWRGRAYGDLGELPFARAEARRLDELHATAREKRAELLVAVGRVEEAVVALSEMVAEDPLRERPQGLLIEALHRAGRPGEALGVFQQYRRLLSEELGLEPSSWLRELEASVIRRELPDGAPQGAVGRSGAGDRGLAAAPDLRIAYLELSGGPLAWATAGDGPDLVVVPAFVGNLGAIAAGDDPRSPALARLARHFRLVLYDRRGTGLSTFGDGDFSLTGGVRELSEVFAALRLGPCAVLGVSQAGPIALAFAHHHPELVTRLVLHGTYADGPGTFGDRPARDSLLALTRSAWGLASRVLTDMMYPGESVEMARRLARMQRESATPEVAGAMLEALYEADVAALLPEIRAPALVTHYAQDRAVPFAGGRDLAAALPRARFVPLPGECHLPADADLDRLLELIVDFLR